MNTPMVLVRYLPQFHQIPENDRWWGNGFTEWTAVRKGIPIYQGHRQPRVPKDENYYNLLNKETMHWQAELGRKYNIGGFCFYHYWFKDGRKILEKPAENLLEWQDISMPFCFTWANETWARTWSNLREKNAWADNFEQDSRENSDFNGILLEQKYGQEKDWKEHFDYLLPFFKDKRYIKKDNKPVFVIYKPDDIFCLGDMMRCWNQWIKDEGFEGIYVIGETWIPYMPWDSLDAQMVRFPNAAFAKINVKKLTNGLSLYNYDDLWNVALAENYYSPEGKKCYLCGVVDFDTTPRKGCNGDVLTDGNADKFYMFFDECIKQNILLGNEYVFLNAWNEWGEGMYLEPDTTNKYGYLEAVKNIIEKYSLLDNQMGSLMLKNKMLSKADNNIDFEKRLYRLRKENRILNAWMNLHRTNKSITKFLSAMGWQKIAVYGLGNLGQQLVEDLQGSAVEIQYIIDCNADRLISKYPLYQLQKNLPMVDGIIITPSGLYEFIRKDILKYINVPLISLEEVILENV